MKLGAIQSQAFQRVAVGNASRKQHGQSAGHAGQHQHVAHDLNHFDFALRCRAGLDRLLVKLI